MLFDNVFFSSVCCVIFFSFIVCFVGFFIVCMILGKKDPRYVQYKKNRGKVYLAASVCSLTISFFLTIVICTFTPSLITVESDLNYTKELSFFSDGRFIGIGGSYISNHCNRSLRLVGIGEDDDIDVVISSGSIEKVRKCPEVYFKKVPDHQYVGVTRDRRGRRKTFRGPSLYLVEY